MLYKLVELVFNFIKGNEVNENNFTLKTIWLILFFLGGVLGYSVYLTLPEWISEFGELRVHDLNLQTHILEIKDSQINDLDMEVINLSNEVEGLTHQIHDLEISNLQSSLELETTKSILKDETTKRKVLSERLTNCLSTYQIKKE